MARPRAIAERPAGLVYLPDLLSDDVTPTKALRCSITFRTLRRRGAR